LDLKELRESVVQLALLDLWENQAFKVSKVAKDQRVKMELVVFLDPLEVRVIEDLLVILAK